MTKSKAALLASALLVMPAPAFAQQEEVTEQANAIADQAQQLEQETNTLTNLATEDEGGTEGAAGDNGREDDRRGGDDDFPWGLLGLLGLAGLLGLKRRDDDRGDRDRDYRGTTGGTTGSRTGTGTGAGMGTGTGTGTGTGRDTDNRL